jgi:hypothetical protein
MTPGLRWRRLVMVQEFYCCAVEAGVTAELGFDQSDEPGPGFDRPEGAHADSYHSRVLGR